MRNLILLIISFLYFPTLSAQSNYDLGLEKTKQGDYKTAVKMFTKFIDENPSDAKPYFERGNALDKMEKSDEALYDYKKAFELDPCNLIYIMAKGNLEAGLTDYKDAIVTFTRAIELKPDNDEGYLNRAFAKNLNEDKKGAQADMMKAMSLNSKYAQPEILNGVDNFLEGNKELACTEWKKVTGVGKAQAQHLIDIFCTDHSKKSKK